MASIKPRRATGIITTATTNAAWLRYRVLATAALLTCAHLLNIATLPAKTPPAPKDASSTAKFNNLRFRSGAGRLAPAPSEEALPPPDFDNMPPTMFESVPPPTEEGLPPPRRGNSPSQEELPPAPTVEPPLDAKPTAPVPKDEPVLLGAGQKITLRVCRMLPKDELSPGERLLNSRPPLQQGDRFLAEVIAPLPPHPVLVGGTVTKITKPGWFGRPGHLTFQMAQLVRTVHGPSGPVSWQLDLADQRFSSRMRRACLTTLLGLEGAVEGASVGAQFVPGNMGFIGGGLGIGLLVGLGYASFQRGSEANLEPGDTFQIVVGTTHYRPVPREWETMLYPAADANRGRGKKK